jgi:hypothetical protein
MRHPRRLIASAVTAAVLMTTSPGTSSAAFQIVELSAEIVVPGAVLTMRVAMSGRTAGTEPAGLFLIPSGTFGDAGPESLPCEQFARSVEVGETHWEAGTVEFEGRSYDGLIGGATFTVPDLPADTYHIVAESPGPEGAGCHMFALIQVVDRLPNTALPVAEQ